jgi:queuine tRNA-ribosyltransferase
MFSFRVHARCPRTRARTGSLATPHGSVETPLFMPVGTRGTVKGISPDQLTAVGTEMLLANAYHLALRPGPEIVRELGGLHELMAWKGPILTDSGGYQVFSLAHLTSVDEDGATVKSVVDGTPIRLTPESVIEIEQALGADVIMALDHCPADPMDRDQVGRATERTHRWLERCVHSWRAGGGVESGQALFGIVQGGAFEDLRLESAAAVTAHDLPGYAIGGVSVGEDREAVLRAIETAAPRLPEDKPRYLMGVGTPLDFLDAVERGIDMFDCVTPTRHGRNHQAFTSEGRINLRNRTWLSDRSPLDPDCDCSTCTCFSKGTLRHLCTSGEMLGGILLTVHNLRFFHRLLEDMRAAIPSGTLPDLRGRIEQAQRRL